MQPRPVDAGASRMVRVSGALRASLADGSGTGDVHRHHPRWRELAHARAARRSARSPHLVRLRCLCAADGRQLATLNPATDATSPARMIPVTFSYPRRLLNRNPPRGRPTLALFRGASALGAGRIVTPDRRPCRLPSHNLPSAIRGPSSRILSAQLGPRPAHVPAPARAAILTPAPRAPEKPMRIGPGRLLPFTSPLSAGTGQATDGDSALAPVKVLGPERRAPGHPR